ncbi:hypothetical protein BC829DRAFT_381565 [Chytridium lagenaria]|nr:hypothetical protein BC829DRAFT_400231 [Chytridium lagenaria]KAI8853888.1 hypothetical protein BC829DRAFT_381565 [Chytridium lagenaria]
MFAVMKSIVQTTRVDLKVCLIIDIFCILSVRLFWSLWVSLSTLNVLKPLLPFRRHGVKPRSLMTD